MSITKGVPIPTSYRSAGILKVRSIPIINLAIWLVTISAYIYIFIKVFVIVQDFQTTVNYMIPVTILALAIGLFSKDAKTLRTSRFAVMLLLNWAMRRNILKKYHADISDLKKVFSIESIESDGLIWYTDRSSAYMMMLQSPRIPEELIDAHNTKVMKAIDSLYGDFKLKLFNISIMERTGSLKSEIANEMNDPGKNPKQKEHLMSIYKHSNEHSSTVVDWKSFAFLKIPIQDTPDGARRAGMNFAAGLSQELKRAGVIVTLIADRNMVAEQFRHIIVPIPRR